MHPVSKSEASVEHYKPFVHDVDMKDIETPLTLHSFDKFERQNHAISGNVFGFENNEILPLRITKHLGRLHHVNLLLLREGELSHYCLIKDLNGFCPGKNQVIESTTFVLIVYMLLQENPFCVTISLIVL